MLGFGKNCQRNISTGCKKSSKGKAILILAAAFLLGLTSSAQAVLFGFHEIGNETCNLPGLVVNITEEGTNGGNVVVHFQFTLLPGTVTTRLDGIYFDDRCLNGQALMSFDNIIDADTGGDPGVDFESPANPGDPPNSNLTCPSFETTGEFSADSNNTAAAVGPGETITLVFTLNDGKSFQYLIDCLQEPDETAVPCIPGLRIGLSIQSSTCGSGAISGNVPIDITDCNGNLIPDECDINGSGTDEDGRPCSLYGSGVGGSEDCNTNDIPDDCEQDVCDDGNPCTDDFCQGGACVNTPIPDCCQTGGDCDDGLFCNGEETCVNGVCQPGTDPCLPGEVCNEDTDTCGECLIGADCDDGNACTTDTCENGVCVNTPSTPAGQCCNPETGALTPIDDGNACTTDTCNPTGSVAHTSTTPAGQCCNPETGALTSIDDGLVCTTDTCNADGSVTHTPIGGDCCEDSGDCDDGLFCNGEETCVDNTCQPGTPPCEPGQICNEDTDTCDQCESDEDCDDGLFCNGEETCVDGVCQPGTPPCPPGTFCNEVTDTCDECQSDADCDDGLFCNGEETCVDGTCQPGTSPCAADETCDENDDTCVPPEPPPQVLPGACCFPDSSCASAADAAACSAAGGVFAGAGTDCSTTSCECGQPGGVSLLFSQLSFAPVCGGGCLMMIPVTILGFLTLRGRRRHRHKSRSR